MAIGDRIPSDGGSWVTIHNAAFDGASVWYYFTGTRVSVTRGPTTFGNTIWLERNTGSNTSPTWSRTNSWGMNDTPTVEQILQAGQLPSWRCAKQSQGLFIGNPTMTINVRNWHGTQNLPIYYHAYSNGTSRNAYVNPQYQTNKGLPITWARARNMTH